MNRQQRRASERVCRRGGHDIKVFRSDDGLFDVHYCVRCLNPIRREMAPPSGLAFVDKRIK